MAVQLVCRSRAASPLVRGSQGLCLQTGQTPDRDDPKAGTMDGSHLACQLQNTDRGSWEKRFWGVEKDFFQVVPECGRFKCYDEVLKSAIGMEGTAGQAFPGYVLVTILLWVKMRNYYQRLRSTLMCFSYNLKGKCSWGSRLTFVAHVAPACDKAVCIRF